MGGGCHDTPAAMLPNEKAMLYLLALAMRPALYAEVGVYHGGSALIVSRAMRDSNNTTGRIIGVDPKPQIAGPHLQELGKRFQLIQGLSPGALAEIKDPIDLALIDGRHTRDAVSADLRGIVPHMRAGGFILFHDAVLAGVDAGIMDVLKTEPRLTDLGHVTREYSISATTGNPAGGLRLVRVNA